jgi:hypothetical protein
MTTTTAAITSGSNEITIITTDHCRRNATGTTGNATRIGTSTGIGADTGTLCGRPRLVRVVHGAPVRNRNRCYGIRVRIRAPFRARAAPAGQTQTQVRVHIDRGPEQLRTAATARSRTSALSLGAARDLAHVVFFFPAVVYLLLVLAEPFPATFRHHHLALVFLLAVRIIPAARRARRCRRRGRCL